MSLPPRWSLVVFLAVVFPFAIGPAVQAQSAPPVDTFDLVLVGEALTAADHRVEMKTNPAEGGRWTVLDESRCGDTGRLLVLPGRLVARYVGQDIRENYLALKVTAETGGSTLRAAYAVPSLDDFGAAACARLARLVETRPMTVRRHSLAAYERPRPVRLRPGTPFIDHVEAPVRHRKPGRREVEWLEILFRQDE